MKIYKIKDKKTLLGAMWHIMFEARWIARWTMHLVYYGGSLLLTYLVYVFAVNRIWFFAGLFAVLLFFMLKRTWVHYKLSRGHLENDTLGEMFEKYGGK